MSLLSDFDTKLLTNLFCETQHQPMPQFVAEAKCGCKFLFYVNHFGAWNHDGKHSKECPKYTSSCDK